MRNVQSLYGYQVVYFKRVIKINLVEMEFCDEILHQKLRELKDKINPKKTNSVIDVCFYNFFNFILFYFIFCDR